MRLSWPMWVMLILALLALLVDAMRERAYYYGVMEYPCGDGTPSHWKGW